MSYDTNREWRIVLFPPYALLIFMTLTLPGALARPANCSSLFSTSAAIAFRASSSRTAATPARSRATKGDPMPY